MRIVFSFLLAASVLPCLAQDLEFPDYRSKKDNFAKIQDKGIRTDVAAFALAAVDESIGKAPLTGLPVKDYDRNFMKWAGENMEVTIRTGVFFPSKHKMQYNEKHLVKIDGHPYYGGNYGEMPKNTIEAITVIVDKDTIPIPPTAYSDLFDPKFSFAEGGATRTRNGVFQSSDRRSHTFYIYLLNIENGGSEYTWVIQNKQFVRRVVDFGFLQK